MVVKTTVSIDEETLRDKKVIASRYGARCECCHEAMKSFNTAESLNRLRRN
jgi:hypothetical protein